MDLKKISMPDLKKLDKSLINKLAMFILIIVFLVIIIIVIKLLKGNRVSYSAIEEKMVVAAKKYYSNNEEGIEKFKDISSKELSVNVDTLVKAGYIKDLTKLTPNKEATCKGKVSAKTNNEFILYTAYLDCGADYKTKYLSDVLKESIVDTGNGLYAYNDYHLYRGEYVNNYVNFADKTWRIIRINNDNTIRLIETTKREKIVWDDRYNIDLDSNDGINDFDVSRIKDSLAALYNNDKEFTDTDKAYILPQNLCIGKRNTDETNIDGTVECSKTYDNFMIGLIQANEYALSSLDANCKTPEDKACDNYNYFNNFTSSYWSITASNYKTSKVYKLSPAPFVTNADNEASIRSVIKIDSNATYVSGDGTLENPYIFK